MFKNIKPQLIGICGGSASGKTTISNNNQLLWIGYVSFYDLFFSS